MGASVVRGAFLALLRLFYPVVSVRGERPEPGAGCIVVANHANGLLDPLVVELAMARPVAFLAKSTLFDVPVLRWLLPSFGALPVYRAKEADTTKNERTFAKARDVVATGGCLALFPEGVSHDEPRLVPLKTGAARIALGCPDSIPIIPVGVLYEAKDTFRSRVSVRFSRAVDVRPFRAEAESDDRAATLALTDHIADAMRRVMLEADDAELWRGFVTVASWLVGEADLGLRDDKARELSAAWSDVARTNPDEAAAIADEARDYARALERLGVNDPWALEPERVVGPVRFVGKLFPLVSLGPFALIGALLGWLPYRSIRVIATRLAKGEADVVGTYKLLLGLVVFPSWWLAESVIIGWRTTWFVGLATLLLAPLTGFVALRWDERLEARRQLLRASYLSATRSDIASAVTARRIALAQRIAEAIAHAPKPERAC